MSSFLYDLARAHQTELIGFGQAFLVSALIVGLGYWLKARLLRGWGAPAAKRLRSSKPATRKQRSSANRRPIPVEATPVVEAPTAAEPVEATPIPPAQPLSLEAHSQRVAEHMRRTIARGERIVALHNRARIRLESADYAFQRLVMDLAHLVSVPKKPEPVFSVIGIDLKHPTKLAA
ncbi:MAG: hypothetical protein DIU57_001255 [Pseudomonadota bacterium]|jgi:hypothetical protein|nr:MAG: hypothetical protein DIU57_03590 [Pseudomonadota bacterium]